MEQSHKLDHALLKLPRSEGFLAGLSTLVAAVYDQQAAMACTELIGIIGTSRNRLKAESFSIDLLNAEAYWRSLLQHIALVGSASAKLEYPEQHFKHLKFSTEWLDTFSGDTRSETGFALELDSCRYNLLLLGLFVVQDDLRRQKNESVINRCRKLRYCLMQIGRRDIGPSKSVDLCAFNLDIVGCLIAGSQLLATAREMQKDYSTNTKLLPKDVASAYWKAHHFYRKSRSVASKNAQFIPEVVAKFYSSQSCFSLISSKLKFCELMIRHLQLFLSDDPLLFGHILGYAQEMVRVLAEVRREQYSSEELTMLQVYWTTVKQLQLNLSHRNLEIYHTSPTPESMLPVPDVSQDLSCTQLDAIEILYSQRVRMLLSEFWTEQVDAAAYRLCQSASRVVSQVESSLSEVSKQLHELQQHNSLQRGLKGLKLIMTEGPAVIDGPSKLTQQHENCRIRLEQLSSKLQSCPNHTLSSRVLRWAATTQQKLTQAYLVNQQLEKKREVLVPQAKRLQQAVTEYTGTPSIEKLQSHLERLSSNMVNLRQMVRVPYCRKLTDKCRSLSLGAAEQQLAKQIKEAEASWMEQITKLLGHVRAAERLNKCVTDPTFPTVIETISALKQGLEFYNRLLPEIGKVQDTLQKETS